MERTPEQEAAYALDNKLSRDDLPPKVQAEYDRQLQARFFASSRGEAPPLGPVTEAEPWRPLTPEERKSLTKDQKKARRQQWWAMSPQERQQHLREITDARQHERLDTKGIAFYGLGVRVRAGEVFPYPTLSLPAIGPAEGARAEITDPTKAQMVRAGVASGLAFGAVFGPLALAPGLLRKSKAVAFVVCTNGKLHEKKLDGTTAIRNAQRDVMRFNALAGPAEASAPEPPQPPTPSERLAEVTRLHEEDLLTEEEYQTKRAEIISQL